MHIYIYFDYNDVLEMFQNLDIIKINNEEKIKQSFLVLNF